MISVGVKPASTQTQLFSNPRVFFFTSCFLPSGMQVTRFPGGVEIEPSSRYSYSVWRVEHTTVSNGKNIHSDTLQLFFKCVFVLFRGSEEKESSQPEEKGQGQSSDQINHNIPPPSPRSQSVHTVTLACSVAMETAGETTPCSSLKYLRLFMC